jgi:hypothetical protein
VNAKMLFPLLAVGAAAVFVAIGTAGGPDSPQLTSVATANTRAAGYAPATKLSPELYQVAVAQGSTAVENPQDLVTNYGYENDTPTADNPAVPQMVPTSTSPTEAQKTEPDKNTYLVFKRGLKGADHSYEYGTRFLYQGHEAGKTLSPTSRQGVITRINLDADAAHRVTVMATKDVNGQPIQAIDGSTWYPYADKLLFTTENPNAPTYSATADYPSSVEDVSGALGRGGYEGIQSDNDGNLWIVEDIGGANKPGAVASKFPNSYVYRYVPAKPGDLAHGKLQALQVLTANSQPITFASQSAVNAPDQVALHSYGSQLSTRWVTVHDTAVDGNAPFNANTAAKTAQATPFKRPENGVFRPDSRFGEFYFTETGDTSSTSTENANAGGWGGVFVLKQSDPSAATGKISVLFKGSERYTGLDNITFLSKNQVAVVEDAGAGLHQSRNALDSAYALNVGTDYSVASNLPVRFIAEGRDASATLDAGATPVGFGKNEDDNELTGIHVSDGDTSIDGLLGARSPNLQSGDGKWRLFYTQQHGDNPTYEVIYDKNHGDGDH